MKKILVGITGGIAAYKMPRFVSLLVQEKYTVDVVMTEGAKKFISPLTFSTLTGRPVYTDLFSLESPQPLHIRLANETEAFIIAPATANTIAKIALGFADNLLTSIALALPQKTHRLIVPSMDENMFLHPATQKNLSTLSEWGWTVIQPEEGRLATGKIGKGRMPEPEVLFEKLVSLITTKKNSKN